LQALLQIAALREGAGRALKRGLRLQRRQIAGDGASTFTGAQAVDRGVQIGRRRFDANDKQKQAN